MSQRVDFSSNACIYDRRHGVAISDEGLERLWSAAGLGAGARVLDIGTDTGRVAIPLADRGCTVVGVEPASGMLAQLRAKAGDNTPSLSGPKGPTFRFHPDTSMRW